MSDNKKDKSRKTFGTDSTSEEASKAETFGEAMDKAGFEPLPSEKKIVGQGRPRETLRKRSPGVPNSTKPNS